MLQTWLLAAALLTAPSGATETVERLQKFIRTQTVNPPGNESSLTVPLFDEFEEAGLDAELTGADSKRLNLIVKIPGRTNAKPIVVLAHVDTVLADPKQWKVDPFAGKVSDGNLWGRGALDDKGMAAALAGALLRLHASGQKPDVAITAVFAVDEETGSELGIEWLFKHRPKIFDASFVMNEGGFVILDPDGPAKKTYYVSVGEKGVAWLRLTATGTPGHGSIRWGDNANEKLLGALAKIIDWEHPRVPSSPMGQFAMADLRKQGKRARSVREALRDHPIGPHLESDPKLASTLRTTCNLTVLEAGEKPNVIPSTAQASVDCRVATGTTPERFLAQVRQRIAGSGVKAELIARSNPNVSEWHTPMFAALERAAHRLDKDSLVVPVLAAGATDSRFFRYRGIPAYGLVPIPVPEEFVQGMHGVNERIPVEGLIEAEDFLYHFLRDVAGYPQEKP